MNMSYCRFQNTKNDLRDCVEHIGDDVSPEEHKARIKLIELCRDIVDAADNGEVPEKCLEDEDEE